MPKPPVILAYHAVSTTWRSPLAVSEDALREQLGWFRRRGYTGLTFTECERRRRDGSLPHRALVVTFDDGFRSVLRAQPACEELGFPATVFVVTSFVDDGRHLDWPGLEHVGIGSADDRASLTWEELARLQEQGWEVGSHTVSHRLLPDLEDDELAEELRDSREAIVQRLGRCDTVCYPYGLADRRVAAAAASAGYAAGVTLTRAHPVDEPLRRPRVNMEESDRGLRLRLLLSRGATVLRRSSLLDRLEARGGRSPWIPQGPEHGGGRV